MEKDIRQEYKKSSLKKFHSCETPPTISITGASGSGKTTAISHMLPRLNKIGLKDIIVVKNVSGGIDLPSDTGVVDIPAIQKESVGRIKDSDIFISCGARYVIVISAREECAEILTSDRENRRWNLIKIKGQKYKNLTSILTGYVPDVILKKSSLVIAEGFSDDVSIPHIHIDKTGDDKPIPPNIILRLPALDEVPSDGWKKMVDTLASYLYIFYAIYSPRPVFVGVGNDLRGDDAFGPIMVERLSSVFRNFPNKNVEPLFINAQMTPENYIGKLMAYHPTAIVIFDAVSESGVENGGNGLKIFSTDEVLQGAVKFSTHGGGLRMFIDYLKSEMGDDFPPFGVMGVSPSGDLGIGESISQSLEAEISELEKYFERCLKFFCKKTMS